MLYKRLLMILFMDNFEMNSYQLSGVFEEPKILV